MHYIYKYTVHLVLPYLEDKQKLIPLTILTPPQVILLKPHDFIYYLYTEYSQSYIFSVTCFSGLQIYTSNF